MGCRKQTVTHPTHVRKLFHTEQKIKPADLVLHLVLALVHVVILETPLVLDVNVDVKLSSLSLSQLKCTNTVFNTG